MSTLQAETAHQVYQDKENRNPFIQGYTLDDKLSDRHHSVYHNFETNKSHMAIRGSANPFSKTGFNDWTKTNPMLFLGKEEETKRFAKSERKLSLVKEKYGDSISLSGHSLGGQITARLSGKHDVKADAYNPGSFLFQTARNLKCAAFNTTECANQSKNLTVHTVEGDPLSLGWHVSHGASSRRHIRYAAKPGLHPHHMANFLTPAASRRD